MRMLGKRQRGIGLACSPMLPAARGAHWGDRRLWAWRKGYSGHGTILVDLERGIVADLLPDRSAAGFEKWLREHPEVRIISRDRDSVYAEGGYGGAPQA